MTLKPAQPVFTIEHVPAVVMDEVFRSVQLAVAHSVYRAGMMSCAYCDQPASMRIPSLPDQVCAQHGLEFWSGLLLYARDRSDPCVKQQQWCNCRLCEESAAAFLRTTAVKAAGRSPQEKAEQFQIRLAS
jgi:hypothetical protein